jgi:radical SAM protein with 4Fe4S-binding SPASM domain
MIDQHYPVTSGRVLIKKRGDIFLVKDVQTGAQGQANEDLRDLLLLCDGTRTVKEVCEEVSRAYEESKENVKKKVVKSLEFLEDLHFIHCVEDPVYTPVETRDADLEWPLDVAYLEVTNQCNLQCVHCYKTAGESLPEELTTEEWYSVIDELKALGVMTVAITGGEPFMRDDLFDILKYIANSTIGINLLTNGTLVTPADIETLKEIGPEKVIVSLDGATRNTHEKIRGESTFDKTVKTIAMLTENGLPVRSNTVIYTGNIAEIEKIIEMLLGLGVQEMVFDRFMSTGRGKEHEGLIPPLEVGEDLSKIFSTYESRSAQNIQLKFSGDIEEHGLPYSYCGIGTSMITIKADGHVVLCPVLSSPRFTAGTIREDSLKEVWLHHPLFKPFRDCTLDDMACKTCPSKDECKGGCKARVFQYFGTFCQPDPWMCASRGQHYHT